MSIKRSIWVKFEEYGIHQYHDAPEEVSYLRYPHRHKFFFRVEISVEHNDRDIEFHLLLNWLKSLYEEKILQLDHRSCEMIAEDLIERIRSKFRGRTITVEVSEDDECGAILVDDPETL